MMRREPVHLTRTCEGTEIPSGFPARLDEGMYVIPQQVLDGNITARTEWGQLVRIAAADADALGPEYAALAAAAAAARAVRAAGPFDEKKVWEELRTIYDPELPANIVDIGLIYQVLSAPAADGVGMKVTIAMTLTAPGCGVGSLLVDDVRAKVGCLPGVKEVDVQLVFDPPWDQSRMTEAARLALGFW